MKTLTSLIFILQVSVLNTACAHESVDADLNGSASKAPRTVGFVDVQKYVGLWYEIASIPAKFSDKCVANTTAEYSLLASGRVKVLNSCEVESGQREVAQALARVMDKKTNAKIEVSFVRLFKKYYFRLLGVKVAGDYWVIELADDYSYAVVGHPKREYGWILAREPQLPKATLVYLAERLLAQGYNTCDFMTTPANGGLSVRTPLCELLK